MQRFKNNFDFSLFICFVHLIAAVVQRADGCQPTKRPRPDRHATKQRTIKFCVHIFVLNPNSPLFQHDQSHFNFALRWVAKKMLAMLRKV